jgi:hypothetical protein
MAQPLQNITVTAPAFKGLNTQDSPLSGDAQYASIADNMVIDRYGRIGARKGILQITEDSGLNGEPLTIVHECEAQDGTTRLIGFGNGNWWEMGTDDTELNSLFTSSSTSFIPPVNFNDKTYIFNSDPTETTVVYDPTTNTDSLITAEPSASTFQPSPTTAIGAFGRMWCNDSTNPNIVYWSSLLSPQDWTGGSSGSINLDKVWADGVDRVMGLAAWNGFLIIFGYNSIVIYQNPESPANMSLSDTIHNVGCIATESIQATGNDLLFLSNRGLMSLGRVIQEKSNPLNDVSKNIHNDLTTLVAEETSGITSVYSGSEGFYLLLLKGVNIVFCFDTKGLLENGAYRVTRWIDFDASCFYCRQNDIVLIGNTYGVNKYEGYQDNGSSYTVSYYSNPLSFGSPSNIKFLKKIVPTVIGGGLNRIDVRWGYDFSAGYKTQTFNVANSVNAGYFGESEFNTNAEFVAGSNNITTKRINASGSGNLVTVGIASEIDGAPLSIQEFNIQAIIGRTY